MLSVFLINKGPVGISECRSPFSEETRRFWLSRRLMALVILKRDEECSPFEGPFWCCRSLRFGKFQPHFISVPGVHHLGAIQSLKEMRCVSAFFIEVLHALVFTAPARGAPCLSGGPRISRVSSATLWLVIFFRDAEGPRGRALGKELRAIAQQMGYLQIAMKLWGCGEVALGSEVFT